MKTTIGRKLLCVTQLVQDLKNRNKNEKKLFIVDALRGGANICIASLEKECGKTHSLISGMVTQGLAAEAQQDLNPCWTMRSTVFTP